MWKTEDVERLAEGFEVHGYDPRKLAEYTGKRVKSFFQFIQK